MSANATAHTNRLIHETSPYLLQHAHNPVDWYPWGPEALEAARREDKPILLSIGYSSCHWCHVMAHESFEDPEIGRLMNESFICIKVDREERPDLDDIYMTATVMMNQGQGGWPMTVFLTPDQRPFFAGTYFPPTDKHGRPGFKTLLTHLAEAWKSERVGLFEQASELTDMLRRHTTVAPATGVGEAELDRFAAEIAREFDDQWGGFGSRPKFPPSQSLTLLLRQHARTGDPHLVEMVSRTLHAMANGGIYDHVAGGFARYSVDEKWLVPHFEKMLYDNAQLARVYAEAYQATGDAKFARVTREVLDYAIREMTSPSGGFYSATDADSEGEEGKFFVWTPDEIEAILGDEEARRFNTYYDISRHGNFEGKSIPNTPRSIVHVAKELGIEPGELEKSLAASKEKVYQARLSRVPPLLDDKVLTAWNGLMISAMAEGHRVLDAPEYLAAGEKAAEFLLSTLVKPDGRLLRTWRAGKAHLDGYLEDYSYLAVGLIDLYEAGGQARWLEEARKLAQAMLAAFSDPESGAFFGTAHDHESLIVRGRTGTDGAVPSANAMAAHALARLSHHFDDTTLRTAAERAIQAYGRTVRQQPRAFATSLAAVDFLLSGPLELVLVGARHGEDREVLEREIARHYLPNRVLVHHDPAAPAPAGWPLLEGRSPVDGRATLDVCRAGTCLAPLTEPGAVADTLRTPAARQGRQRSLGTTLTGSATPDATRAFAGRFASALPHGYTTLGSTGLTVSRLGFGSYRVDDEIREHRDALGHALDSGINVIDTSTNYALGGSERLIGTVLSERVARGATRRDEVVLVSKIGYVQGPNLEHAQKREQAGQPFDEMVKYTEGCWHCVHPQWLEDQLAKSLDRLRVECLDVCLLHNPEYFLSDAAKESGNLDATRDEFYRRMKDAFTFFEAKVKAGKLRYYGVSSNSAGAEPADPESTSVSRMLEAARAAGGDGHHFRVLQLPMNLLEPGPLRTANTGAGGARTALAAAADAGLAVLVNRPLNAFRADGLVRLADHDVPSGAPPTDRALAAVGALETEFSRRFAPALKSLPAQMQPEQLARFFTLAGQLAGIATKVQGMEHWIQIEQEMILPQLGQVMHLLDRVMQGGAAADWASWRERYMETLQQAVGAIRAELAGRMQAESTRLAAVLDPLLPGPVAGAPLSRKALHVLISTPGVTVTLVGMRRPEYVDDAIVALGWPALTDTSKIYEAFAQP